MERYTEDFLKHAYVRCARCEKELKYGKWVEESRKADGIFDLYQTFIICSICGNEHYYDTGDKPNFCDKCGAKMDLE